MELFLPGIIILLLAGIFAFLVIPRMGTMVLIVASIVAVVLAGLHHYYMFSSEYTLSTWQNGLAAYAPWVIILLALIFLIGAAQYIFTGSSTVAEQLQTNLATSYANMPSSNTATNPLTSAINTGINSISSVMNKRANNSPIIPKFGYSASQV